MFTHVRLKNFLSFSDISFNFKKNNSNAKDFVAIYGENGSGKSNFVQCFDFLCHSLFSFDHVKAYEKISAMLKDKMENEDFPNEILQHFFSTYSAYLPAFRTIGCNEATELEYGFLLNGYEGVYKLSFSERYTQESLYYFTGKQRGYLFKISSDEDGVITSSFNSKIFADAKVREEMIEEINKFWGKHTFIAIIVKQINEKNESYIKNIFSEYILAVIDMLKNTTVFSKKTNKSGSVIVCDKPKNLLHDLRNGRIPKKNLPMLERSEAILRAFFTQAYADIKNVKYETENVGDDLIKYQLFVYKMIAGQVRKISFENESAGTQQVLEIIRTILGLFCGVTVIYDEIDNGIHDILLNQIIHSLNGEINGQLIITTHNTMLLEEIDPHSAYIIQVDYMGNKQVHCVADYSVQSNNNIRTKYLKGLFGGTPYIDGIDYGEIVQEIKEKE